jgi:hypothetical protein
VALPVLVTSAVQLLLPLLLLLELQVAEPSLEASESSA